NLIAVFSWNMTDEFPVLLNLLHQWGDCFEILTVHIVLSDPDQFFFLFQILCLNSFLVFIKAVFCMIKSSGGLFKALPDFLVFCPWYRSDFKESIPKFFDFFDSFLPGFMTCSSIFCQMLNFFNDFFFLFEI